MELVNIIEQYHVPLRARYGAQLLPVQKQVLNAIVHCRTERYGEMVLRCYDCARQHRCFHSCGHRSCPRCQNHETTQWLERQRQKLLPVDYFMVTFTLPYELRSLVWQQPTTVYNAMFACASSTLKDFGINDKKLGASLGLTAVLHTHSRRLDYHPHVHVVVPGGCLNRQRRQWKKMKGKYLFNEFALAEVFRGRLLNTLSSAGLSIPDTLPNKWVVDCRHVGKGEPALKYLSRYLYRGVISEKNIIANQNGQVTFQYVDSTSGKTQTRTLKGEDFLWLLLQHVLPKGFRRVRDYGFLHGNAKKMLMLIQWILRVVIKPKETRARPSFTCPHCKAAMHIIAFIRPNWRSG
ncbi:MAG: IS91 family transposase [bacterium]|nr:IS91 family transposase [bacterium]